MRPTPVASPRTVLACAAFACFLTACTDDKPAAAAAPREGTVYGKITEGPTVSPSAVLADLDAFDGKAVRLTGIATAVCQRAGCWMDVADEKASIRIKVRDGEVVFPVTAKGRRVIAEGVVVKIPADPANDPAACGKGHAHGEEHHDCARPRGASARLDGVGATVFHDA